MKYKIVGDMGVWEQVLLKDDIEGILIDYEVKYGSTIVWQIYECPIISDIIKNNYRNLSFISLEVL